MEILAWVGGFPQQGGSLLGSIVISIFAIIAVVGLIIWSIKDYKDRYSKF